MGFITNHPQKDLAARLADLTEASLELNFPVGFFLSGRRELYEPLRKAAESTPDLKLKILVGLSADRAARPSERVVEGESKSIHDVFWADRPPARFR